MRLVLRAAAQLVVMAAIVTTALYFPLGALLLIGLGVRELSGVPAALPAVRQAVRQVSASDCRTLAESALQLESAAEVRALAAELLNGEAR